MACFTLPDHLIEAKTILMYAAPCCTTFEAKEAYVGMQVALAIIEHGTGLYINGALHVVASCVAVHLCYMFGCMTQPTDRFIGAATGVEMKSVCCQALMLQPAASAQHGA